MSKSNFNRKQIEKIAVLLKLQLKKRELDQFCQEMSDTLKAIDNLNELKTDNIKPTFQTTGITNRFQQEKINERQLNKADVFKNSQQKKNDFFEIKALNFN